MKYDIENGMLVNDSWNESERDPAFHCDMCSEPIYEGDTYFKVYNNRYCECCIDECREEA